MFIKIVNEEKYARDTLIECDRYSMWEMGKPEKFESQQESQDYIPKIMIEIRGSTDMDYEVIKDGNTVVYILNNKGKTIDSFRWPKVA